MGDKRTLPKCSYGCNREAKKLFKNGNWCCSEHVQQCPVVKNRISEGLKNSSKVSRAKPNARVRKTIASYKKKKRNVYTSGFFGFARTESKIPREGKREYGLRIVEDS